MNSSYPDRYIKKPASVTSPKKFEWQSGDSGRLIFIGFLIMAIPVPVYGGVLTLWMIAIASGDLGWYTSAALATWMAGTFTANLIDDPDRWLEDDPTNTFLKSLTWPWLVTRWFVRKIKANK